MKLLLVTIAILTWTLLNGEAAKVLYVIPTHGKSHYIAQVDLPLELAKRGHEVHVITTIKEKDPPPNYHQVFYDIDDEKMLKKMGMNQTSISFFLMRKLPQIVFMAMTTLMGTVMVDPIFESTDVQNFLKEDHKFDVVFCELFFNDATYMLAHKYNAPLILVSTFGHSMRAGYNARNPLQLSTLYHEQGCSENPLSFLGRLKNFILFLSDLFFYKLFYLPKQKSLALKYMNLSEPVPDLDEIAGNAALVLLNNHYTMDVPGAYLPNFIEVGGMSQKAAQALPEDLETIMNNSKEGVIYMSFGSAIKIKDLGDEKLNAFLNAFRELKQTVLMRWDDDVTLENAPNNVVMRKWFPQRDIVAHKNMKLFISHGGLIGLTEAVYSGVPVIGMPIFADQPMNLYHVKRLGFGEIIQHDDITEANLKNLLHKVLSDKKYKENAQIVSQRFKDRPMNGLDTAVWWSEYVIRHKGASFMKTPGLEMSLVEYQMWDVYAFLLAVSYLYVYSFIKIVKIIWKKMFNRDKKNTKKNKQNTKKNM